MLRAKTFVLLGRRVGIAAVFIAIAVINNEEDCCRVEARRHQLCWPTQNLLQFNEKKKRQGETFRAGPIFFLSCVCVLHVHKCAGVYECSCVCVCMKWNEGQLTLFPDNASKDYEVSRIHSQWRKWWIRIVQELKSMKRELETKSPERSCFYQDSWGADLL